MKNVTIMPKVCPECPCHKNALPGSLVLKDAVPMVGRALFPCHMDLEAVSGSNNTGIEMYKETKDVFHTCRGWVEMHMRSNLIQEGTIFEKLAQDVLDQGGLTDGTLDIMETIEMHQDKGMNR